MKKLTLALLILAQLPALVLAQPITMTTAQKIKLTVTPTPAGTIPVGTLMVWSVEGATPAAPKGVFQPVVGDDLAAWYLPSVNGTHVVRVSLVVEGQTFPASATLTVTYVVPTSVAIIAGTPVPR